jgi:hypothetical protein
MKARKIVFLLMVLGLHFWCIQQLKSQTIQNLENTDYYSGVFGYHLTLTVRNPQIKGYYYNSRGWVEEVGVPSFSCAFLIKGSLKDDKRYEIEAFTLYEDTRIRGEVEFANKTVRLRLDNEPPGCSNVEPFSFVEGVELEETEKGSWIGVGVVTKRRNYFYEFPNRRSRTKKYLIKYDFIRLFTYQGEWVKVEFAEGEKPIRGWMRKRDLFIIN